MHSKTCQISFPTKKAAKDAGYLTLKSWFAKFRVPRPGEIPMVVKGEDFFHENQTEEVFSISKGSREIGPLRPGVEPVGKKRFRSVRYVVYRESDFDFEPKKEIARNIKPARTVDLLDAVLRLHNTAAKYSNASTAARQRKDHKRARGFKKRMNGLLELADIGIRRAINEEQVRYVSSRGKTHRYRGDGYLFVSSVAPPEWMLQESKSNYNLSNREPNFKASCRLMDAIFTIERLKNDPTLDW